MTDTAIRKFAANRYFKRVDFFLDHDDGQYTNVYRIFDGDMDTGIAITDSGDRAAPNSTMRSFYFHGQSYPSLHDAVVAYEDKVDA